MVRHFDRPCADGALVPVFQGHERPAREPMYVVVITSRARKHTLRAMWSIQRHLDIAAAWVFNPHLDSHMFDRGQIRLIHHGLRDVHGIVDRLHRSEACIDTLPRHLEPGLGRNEFVLARIFHQSRCVDDTESTLVAVHESSSSPLPVRVLLIDRHAGLDDQVLCIAPGELRPHF